MKTPEPDKNHNVTDVVTTNVAKFKFSLYRNALPRIQETRLSVKFESIIVATKYQPEEKHKKSKT